MMIFLQTLQLYVLSRDIVDVLKTWKSLKVILKNVDHIFQK